jgi:hypothetical protein
MPTFTVFPWKKNPLPDSVLLSIKLPACHTWDDWQTFSLVWEVVCFPYMGKTANLQSSWKSCLFAVHGMNSKPSVWLKKLSILPYTGWTANLQSCLTKLCVSPTWDATKPLACLTKLSVCRTWDEQQTLSLFGKVVCFLYIGWMANLESCGTSCLFAVHKINSKPSQSCLTKLSVSPTWDDSQPSVLFHQVVSFLYMGWTANLQSHLTKHKPSVFFVQVVCLPYMEEQQAFSLVWQVVCLPYMGWTASLQSGWKSCLLAVHRMNSNPWVFFDQVVSLLYMGWTANLQSCLTKFSVCHTMGWTANLQSCLTKLYVCSWCHEQQTFSLVSPSCLLAFTRLKVVCLPYMGWTAKFQSCVTSCMSAMHGMNGTSAWSNRKGQPQHDQTTKDIASVKPQRTHLHIVKPQRKCPRKRAILALTTAHASPQTACRQYWSVLGGSGQAHAVASMDLVLHHPLFVVGMSICTRLGQWWVFMQ